MSTNTIEHNEVARRAYQLWEDAGRPAGRDLKFWILAEATARGAAPAHRPEPQLSRDTRTRPNAASRSASRKHASSSR